MDIDYIKQCYDRRFDMSTKTMGTVLLVPVAGAMGAAAATLLPANSLRGNDLGYHSWCPFAPWSTLILTLVAGVIWVIRGYVLTSSD
jgi:hypothetical protein